MIYITLLTILASLIYAVYSGSTIIITLIKGFMVGALYNKDEHEDFDAHTVQFCLAILTITILWNTEEENG
jgi:hypothetical protein